MTETKPDDAVRFFSENAKEFNALYGDEPNFLERLEVWEKLLTGYAVRGGKAVDMGCGGGVFSFRLAQLGCNVIGIDGAPDMVALCEAQRHERGLDNARFRQGRLPDIDEAGLENADLVISSSVVEYVGDLDRTLALFARLLKPGGKLILSMPNVHSLSRTYQRLKHRVAPRANIYRYILHFSSPGRLARRLAPLGFTLHESAYYTHNTRLAILGRRLHVPRRFTEDLFVAAFSKR